MVALASTERASGVIASSFGGSLKRKQSDINSDNVDLRSSQTKRRKVTFDPDVDVRILSDANEKSLELVGEEVVELESVLVELELEVVDSCPGSNAAISARTSSKAFAKLFTRQM